MTGKELVMAIVEGRTVDTCAYWTGSPHGDSWLALFKYFDCGTPEDVYRKLGDDIRWIRVGGLTASTALAAWALISSRTYLA